ncbi:pentatricopeptide repeat-containing protein chloroplastic-like [Trifolium medium]|uniref:Pentatricopeptide repeat-containing protein chloroplastic-like n=1 Tax=Trifolium medium TaxID=97028 RepID=A0A392NAE4_9FABA|nr:pentatricopeptide repeat-containing protein chloroplastic-like [Trifolium medium]
MVCEGIVLDVSTFNVLIKALCKAHQLKPAILMFEDMVNHRGLNPDEKTFTTLMQGFIEQDDLNGALKIKKQMLGEGDCAMKKGSKLNVILPSSGKPDVQNDVGTSTSVALSRPDMIAELKATCKELVERKSRLEHVIAALEKEEADQAIGDKDKQADMEEENSGSEADSEEEEDEEEEDEELVEESPSA